jgi:uncharacterized protein YgiM (DUF1202 family)
VRIGGLALVVLLVACAEKSTAPEMAAPPPTIVQPSAPARPEPSSAPPLPPAVTQAPPGSAPPTPPSREPPSTERPITSVVFVGVQRANFRQSPDVKARILAVLTKGTKLTVLEKRAQWYRVRLDDGKEGWVAESVTSTKPD